MHLTYYIYYTITDQQLPTHTVILFSIQKVQQLYASQNECEKQHQLLVKVKQSCEQELERLQQKHAEAVESAHQKHSERVELMQGQLKKKERYLNEHRLFVRVSLQYGIMLLYGQKNAGMCVGDMFFVNDP